MTISISRPNFEGDHTILLNGVEVAPHEQLALPSETLEEICLHILKYYPISEYEDLYISIGDELHYREENSNA